MCVCVLANELNRCFCGELFCYICGGPRGEDIPDCMCPLYGRHERRTRMAHRPGLKPPQFRRHRVQVPGRPADFDAPRKIPQLRPWPGEWPLAWGIPRRRMRGRGRFVPVGDVNRRGRQGGGGQLEHQRQRDRPAREPLANGDRPVREPLVNADQNHAAQQQELEELRAWRPRRIEADERDRQASEAATAQARREQDARQREAEALAAERQERDRQVQEAAAAEAQRERDVQQLLERQRQAEALAIEEQREREVQEALAAEEQRRQDIRRELDQYEADVRAAEAQRELEVPQLFLDHQGQAEEMAARQRRQMLGQGRLMAAAQGERIVDNLAGDVPGRHVRFDPVVTSSSSSSEDGGGVERDRSARRERDRKGEDDRRRRDDREDRRRRRHLHGSEFRWNRRRTAMMALPGVVRCMLAMVGVTHLIELQAWRERRENRRWERRRRRRERRRENGE